MKVYVVLKGGFEDRGQAVGAGIEGVFRTKKHATAYVEAALEKAMNEMEPDDVDIDLEPLEQSMLDDMSPEDIMYGLAERVGPYTLEERDLDAALKGGDATIVIRSRWVKDGWTPMQLSIG